MNIVDLCEREPKRVRMSDPLVETSTQIENQELTARYLKTYFDNLVLSQLPEAATVDEFLENPLTTKPRAEFLSILFNDDDTILTHVVKNQNIKAVAALVKAGVDLNQFNRKGITPISAAAHKGNIDIMQLLIEGGALVNALNNSGSTALIQAAHFGHADAVSLLLRSKAMADFANLKGTTALMRASQEGHVNISRLLIRAGADVNRKNNEGMNALMLASQRGHSDMALLLIKAGAVIDEQTSQGSTALMLACKRGHEKVVEVLVSMGAELYVRDSRNRCARDTAEKRQHFTLLHWLDTQVQVRRIQEYRCRQRNCFLHELRKSYVSGKVRLSDSTMKAMVSLTDLDCARVTDPSVSPSLFKTSAARTDVNYLNLLSRQRRYQSWQWPLILMRCLELPLGVFDLILDYLPLPRVWHWSLWCLKRRCRLAPLVAVADSYVIIDEILTDANIFKSNDQKGLLVRISRDQEVRNDLVRKFGMKEDLVNTLVLWSDLQSLVMRCTEAEVVLKPNLAHQVLTVAITLYKWSRYRACALKAFATSSSTSGMLGAGGTYLSRRILTASCEGDLLEVTDAGGEDDGSETAIDQDQDTESENPVDGDNDANDDDDLDSDGGEDANPHVVAQGHQHAPPAAGGGEALPAAIDFMDDFDFDNDL